MSAEAARAAHEAGIQRRVDARCLEHQLTWMRRSAVDLLWAALVRLAVDRERLADALAVERGRAQAAADSRTRFFAAASHDLR